MNEEQQGRLVVTIHEVIEDAKVRGLKVLLVLNSVTACAKIAEQVRLMNLNPRVAVQKYHWMINFDGPGSITMFPKYDPEVHTMGAGEWFAPIRGNEWHKGNSEAFVSFLAPSIRLPLPALPEGAKGDPREASTPGDIARGQNPPGYERIERK